MNGPAASDDIIPQAASPLCAPMQSLPLTGRNYPVVGIIDGGVADLPAIAA
ncbi:hypothetical protein [Mesorhizobium sp.]|uniref:hypothetical protein n=1 Tax=Mesorhizobium sp. TaxID=1871066 RepID=UPI00257B81C6|nr:hypothetical protein [Mesorhizobium sp.]